MAYRADTAEALHQYGDFGIRSTLDEFLKAAEFDNMKARLMHPVILIQQQGDLAVTFDSGNRLDHDPFQVLWMGGSF
jgi:hypothetical protein